MILKNHDTNFVQIPPRTKTRMVAGSKDPINWHTRSIATWFYLSLFADEGVEFSLCRFNFWPPNAAKLKQPIQQLPKQMERRIFVTSNDDLRKERAQSLSNLRTCVNSRETGAHEIFEEATAVFMELFSEETAVYLFKGRSQTGPFQEMFLWDCSKTRMIRQSTTPTSQWRVNHYSASPFAVNNTQSGEIPECQIAIAGTPRVQVGEIEIN